MNAGSFSRVGLQVLLVSVLVHVIQIGTRTTVPIILLSNLCCLVYMRSRAARAVADKRDDFDPVIAAEVMVAFGVLSLIFGLATAIIPLLAPDAPSLVDFGALRRLAGPFVEGLATAGAAPFFAVLLRLKAFEDDRAVDTVGDLAGLSDAARDLSAEFRAAVRTAKDLQAALLSASSSTGKMARDMETEGERFGSALVEGQGYLRGFTAATQASGGEMNRLTGETQRLGTAASDAGTLLEALGRLIEAVERFVSPAADPVAPRKP